MADGGGGDRGWLGLLALGSVFLIGLFAGPAGGTTTGTTAETNDARSSTTASGSSTVVTSSTTTAPVPLTACPGRVVRQRTENGIALRVYYDAQSHGVNCVSAVYNGAVSSPGYLRTELRFSMSLGNGWPDYASQDGPAGAAEVQGTYLIATDDRCVSAMATYFPSGPDGPSSSAALTRVACG